IRRGELEDASRILERIKTGLPKALGTLELEVRLDLAYDKRGLANKRTEAVELIQKRAEEQDAPLLGLASLMEGLGEIDKAEKLYLKAMGKPKKPEDVLQVAVFYARTNRPDKGLEICERARKTCSLDQVALVSVA